jgi:hypothetical protein
VTGSIWIVKADTEEAARKLVDADGFVHAGALKLASVRAFFAAGGAWIGAVKPAGRSGEVRRVATVRRRRRPPSPPARAAKP